MTRRRSRLGEEDRAHKVAAEGAEVFKAAKDDARPAAYFVGESLTTGELAAFKCRWPAATARAQTGEIDVVVPEVIDMASKPKVGTLATDPYLRAEEVAAERQQAKARKEVA